MPWSPAQSRNRSKASSGVSHGSGALPSSGSHQLGASAPSEPAARAPVPAENELALEDAMSVLSATCCPSPDDARWCGCAGRIPLWTKRQPPSLRGLDTAPLVQPANSDARRPCAGWRAPACISGRSFCTCRSVPAAAKRRGGVVNFSANCEPAYRRGSVFASGPPVHRRADTRCWVGRPFVVLGR